MSDIIDIEVGTTIDITYKTGSVHGGATTRRVRVTGFDDHYVYTVDDDGDEIRYRWDELLRTERVKPA